MANILPSRRDKIIIRGARVNNLKNINIDIPRDKFVVITGLSGSGKSSLAFDTVYAEGNRRYMEGLSAYARNFLDVSAKPDVDRIENLSPSISIDQKSISRSPRSTVGTLTEIYDYLRVLFAKVGKAHCPDCGEEMKKENTSEIAEDILLLPGRTNVAILAKPKEKHASYQLDDKEVLRQIQQWGYARVRFNKKIMTVSEALMITSDKIFSPIEVVVDRIIVDKKRPDRERIIDSIETAIKIGGGSVIVSVDSDEDRNYNQDFICAQCGFVIKEITPRNFSFNSPEGACLNCAGLGFTLKINPDLVIPNKNLSLSEGAIQPWSKSGGKINSQTNYLAILKSLAKVYGFSINVPVRKLNPEHLRLILFGDSGKNIAPQKIQDLGGVTPVNLPFEGVIPGLEKKYQETKSDYLRAEIERYMVSQTCPVCDGKRLKKEYLSVMVGGKSIDEAANLDAASLKSFLASSENWQISEQGKKIAKVLAKEMIVRLDSLENVGLEYLNLARSAHTISGGEAQRIRLAVQLNSRLMGITYVLDEPSIGLHNRDTEKLVATMRSLQNTGNSLLVVEHDERIIRSADWIIDMGPGAGEDGGLVVFEGALPKLLKTNTLTADYLTGRKKVCDKGKFRAGNKKFIEIIGAQENNLKDIDVKIPLEKFVVICGVSGSGKSTLVQDILSKALAKHFYRAKESPGKFKKLKGLEAVDKVISIDQNPIGKTPRSNAATYTGVFSHIRELFSGVEEAKSRGYAASQFSFNMKGGRCEVCQGEGLRKIEMHLLPDMYVKCDACDGTRYNKKTLEIEFKGHNVSQVLDMDINFALHFFASYPLITEKLKTMENVGLGYLKLGQSATNLSGGEAQRIKLATELARKSTGKTLYILDEPTVGLHFDDIRRLVNVLDALVEKGNTVLVVEHNLDMIKNADWVVELGPEGGNKGGEIIFEGMPDKLKKCKKSWTAKYL
jgi:excinuclease ABC subunit A